MTQSHLELQFATLWNNLYPHIILDAEVKLIPRRKFRFDFVHKPTKVAIEINGGNWVNGRHTRAEALLNEYEKINLAQMEGYQIFLLTNEMMTEEWLHKIYEQIYFLTIKQTLMGKKKNE